MIEHRSPLSGRITALDPQKRRPDRLSLYLDGRFACGISERTAQDRGLHVGKDLTPEDLSSLMGDEETQRAVNAACLLLSYRARSKAEIHQRLTQKGFPASLIERVTDDLTAAGLLDDSSFAEGWVQNRQRTQPRGKSLLKWELRQKGISRDETEAALDALTPEDEVAGARQLAHKYLERDTNTDPRIRQRRVTGQLQRRGYSWETIREALGPLDDLLRGDEPFTSDE